MGAQLGGACGAFRYPALYSVDGSIRSHGPKIDTRRFAIMQSGQAFTIPAR